VQALEPIAIVLTASAAVSLASELPDVALRANTRFQSALPHANIESTSCRAVDTGKTLAATGSFAAGSTKTVEEEVEWGCLDSCISDCSFSAEVETCSRLIHKLFTVKARSQKISERGCRARDVLWEICQIQEISANAYGEKSLDDI
jgi:hypothetical protein